MVEKVKDFLVHTMTTAAGDCILLYFFIGFANVTVSKIDGQVTQKPLTIENSEGFCTSNSDIDAKYIIVSRETSMQSAYFMKYICLLIILINEFHIICTYVYNHLLLIFQINLNLFLPSYLVLFPFFSSYLFVRYPIGQVETTIL